MDAAAARSARKQAVVGSEGGQDDGPAGDTAPQRFEGRRSVRAAGDGRELAPAHRQDARNRAAEDVGVAGQSRVSLLRSTPVRSVRATIHVPVEITVRSDRPAAW